MDENDEMYILYLFRALTFFYHRHTAYCLRGWQKHSSHQFSQFKAKQDQRAVTTVAIKKGGGGHKLDKKKAPAAQREIVKSETDVSENSADEVPKGAKVKTVDRRPVSNM